jgi:hypothetical protein
MHKLLKPEIMNSLREEVVVRFEVTWMDVDPWDVRYVPVGPEVKVDVVGGGGCHLR